MKGFVAPRDFGSIADLADALGIAWANKEAELRNEF